MLVSFSEKKNLHTIHTNNKTPSLKSLTLSTPSLITRHQVARKPEKKKQHKKTGKKKKEDEEKEKKQRLVQHRPQIHTSSQAC
jgi:hypothetical protein